MISPLLALPKKHLALPNKLNWYFFDDADKALPVWGQWDSLGDDTLTSRILTKSYNNGTWGAQSIIKPGDYWKTLLPPR